MTRPFSLLKKINMQSANRTSTLKRTLVISFSIIIMASCEKFDFFPHGNDHGHLKQTKTFSSDVVTRWLDMQLEMLRVPLAQGAVAQSAERCQAYCGITLYEAVVPGMPAYQSLSGQLTNFPVMPETEAGKGYHWAATANAALAEMNRK